MEALERGMGFGRECEVRNREYVDDGEPLPPIGLLGRSKPIEPADQNQVLTVKSSSDNAEKAPVN